MMLLWVKDNWNNKVSSLRVYTQRVPEYGGDGCWVAVCEYHWEHGGWEAVFDQGRPTQEQISHELVLSMTKFSAMQVRGKDCYATGYGHDFSDWEADPFR